MKKLLKFVATVIVIGATCTQPLWAASDNHITSQSPVLPEKTLFIENDGGWISRPSGAAIGSKQGSKDIAYIMTAPYLVIELKDDLAENAVVKLKLTNGKWFFRDGNHTEKFPSSGSLTGTMILSGLSATYSGGSWLGEETSPAGTYTRAGNAPQQGVETDNINYILSVLNTSDAEALVTFPQGGFTGDTVRIPMVVLTEGFNDFYVDIESGGTTISSGKYQFGTADAQSGMTATATPTPVPTTDPAKVEDAMINMVSTAIANQKMVTFVLDKGVDNVNLHKSVLDILRKSGKPFQVRNDVAMLTIDANMLGQKPFDTAQVMTIGLVSTPVDAVQAKSGMHISTVVASMKADGKAVDTFATPVRLDMYWLDNTTVDAKKTTLTAVYVEPNGNRVNMGGTMKNDIFQVMMNSPGRVALVVNPNLLTIKLVVNSTQYTVNGKAATTDVAPIILEDRVMVPVRFVAEAMGAVVGWDDGTQSATIEMNGQKLILRVGQKLPGMDVSPVKQDGRLLVPLRYVSEKLGAYVTWDGANQINIIK